MQAFVRLFLKLEASVRTQDKREAVMGYLAEADAASAAWGIFFLCGKRLGSVVRRRVLHHWAEQLSGMPSWMIEACREQVGDFAETFALLAADCPAESGEIPSLARCVEEFLLPAQNLDETEQAQLLLPLLGACSRTPLFLLIKLLTGSLRMGVAHGLTVQAIASFCGADEALIDLRLSGQWKPSEGFFHALTAPASADGHPFAFEEEALIPYPFYLATALDDPPESLGSPALWRVEWKWDGIRAQVIKRRGCVAVWSRSHEVLTDRFPEVVHSAASLPDGTVLDGELLAWDSGHPLPFSLLQTRITRKSLSRNHLSEAPVVFLAYDCLEADGIDIRSQPLESRIYALERLLVGLPAGASLPSASALKGDSWSDYAQLRGRSRDLGVEGLMLKRLSSPYGSGRTRGSWFKWKTAPLEADAVLVQAQPGNGHRAGLLTDYTFAVWHKGVLLPFARAYSGLNHDEIRELDRWIRLNTLNKRGPVHSVLPLHVFELHFEGVSPSGRHRSGIAVRFPRISRWRRDKTPSEASSLESVQALGQRPSLRPRTLQQTELPF